MSKSEYTAITGMLNVPSPTEIPNSTRISSAGIEANKPEYATIAGTPNMQSSPTGFEISKPEYTALTGMLNTINSTGIPSPTTIETNKSEYTTVSGTPNAINQTDISSPTMIETNKSEYTTIAGTPNIPNPVGFEMNIVQAIKESSRIVKESSQTIVYAVENSVETLMKAMGVAPQKEVDSRSIVVPGKSDTPAKNIVTSIAKAVEESSIISQNVKQSDRLAASKDAKLQEYYDNRFKLMGEPSTQQTQPMSIVDAKQIDASSKTFVGGATNTTIITPRSTNELDWGLGRLAH
jgi:hypothetical protein